jgi:hypothetical protein
MTVCEVTQLQAVRFDVHESVHRNIIMNTTNEMQLYVYKFN